MMQRVVYTIACQDGVWSVRHHDEFVGAFMQCESAVKFANMIAQRNFEADGKPAAVRLLDGDEAVDIILHGEQDPAAHALAWLRRVSALRKRKDGLSGENAQGDRGHIKRSA
ncbi:hypothetical protein [Oleiagrimonas soli]|uniref:DUF2188 domain-containing protein n=1 Tax=Oleiagrimonas soli TaxID=1543381 RepID=A0A099CTE4_9GAMM|nr:hypothetical protein [Oleiagrimonas soli]KGI76946.1 hypothetical protein LF63_0113630 [Oleiagrimonas soli]MBB6185180.1 hypothetical protein [Oleiagrimonas soli]